MMYKEAERIYGRMVKVKFCEMQNLLSYSTRIGFNYSNYKGWNCDFYIDEPSRVIVCTGYSPRGFRYEGFADIIQKYEKEAEDVRSDWTIDDKGAKVKELLRECLKELCEVHESKALEEIGG